jgi:two-component system, chemotaxis family, protein-glutamate methylesterase/glutaminase
MAMIVAIGASQGGLQALQFLLEELPKDFAAPVMIVLHVGRSGSHLPVLLSRSCAMPVGHAELDEELVAGRVYLAPPDHHMLVTDGHIALTRGPRENFARPAIDPLFRSAAEICGRDAIGVVLTGNLNDGTSGLYEIKRRGGIAIVQSPSDAEAPSMPLSAIEHVAVDYCLPLQGIPALLSRLVQNSPKGTPNPAEVGGNAMVEDRSNARPVAQICPECGGAMREQIQGGFTRFECHIGHAMTAEVLADAQLQAIENSLSGTWRRLKERALLCETLADRNRLSGHEVAAKRWQRAADEAYERARTLEQLTQLSWHHPETEPEVQD